MPQRSVDAIVVGGGHNGLVAATLLARAGRSVTVLERRAGLGGAATSAELFPGLGARVSVYSYLVSLFPARLLTELGVNVELRRRPVASYTPVGDDGLLVCDDLARTRDSFARVAGDVAEFDRWQRFQSQLRTLAERIAPTLLEPLRGVGELHRLVADEELWTGIFKRPLAELVERTFASDVVRGVVMTDALIGTFAGADEGELRQNRCFLYHVIGDGTGLWKLPVGGMGALSDGLTRAAAGAGAELRTGVQVTAIDSDGTGAEVRCLDGSRVRGGTVLAAVAPAVLDELLGESSPGPEGSQLKLNMLLHRLPRLRDPHVSSEEAFAGTFHVNEGYTQLQRAFDDAAAGRIPAMAPCEAYCHSLTDPTILAPDLRAAGAHTLTVFALHLPARLFATDPQGAKQAAVTATMHSLDAVLAEPLADCLMHDAEGAPCLHAATPADLESELAMPGGHIFHRDLAWPYAETADEIGRWGVETARPGVLLCGAGARRGGGVSGIPGHNAARALGT